MSLRPAPGEQVPIAERNKLIGAIRFDWSVVLVRQFTEWGDPFVVLQTTLSDEAINHAIESLSIINTFGGKFSDLLCMFGGEVFIEFDDDLPRIHGDDEQIVRFNSSPFFSLHDFRIRRFLFI